MLLYNKTCYLNNQSLHFNQKQFADKCLLINRIVTYHSTVELFILQTPVFDRISKTPTPQRRDIPRVITNGRRVIVDPSIRRKDKM